MIFFGLHPPAWKCAVSARQEEVAEARHGRMLKVCLHETQILCHTYNRICEKEAVEFELYDRIC
jgi:hypothetical protein